MPFVPTAGVGVIDFEMTVSDAYASDKDVLDAKITPCCMTVDLTDA